MTRDEKNPLRDEFSITADEIQNNLKQMVAVCHKSGVSLGFRICKGMLKDAPELWFVEGGKEQLMAAFETAEKGNE